MTNEFIPKGWVLMPRKATNKMQEAAQDVRGTLGDQYKAMVANAPTPPTIKTYSPIPLVEAVESLLEDMAMRARMHGNVDPDGTAVLEVSRGKLDIVHKELGLARLAHMKE